MVTAMLLAGCASESPGHDPVSPAGAKACAVPRAILAGPSPFEAALATYAAEGATANVIARLDSACRDGSSANACGFLALLFESTEGGGRDAARARSYRRTPRGREVENGLLLVGSDADLFEDQGIVVRIHSSYCSFGMQGCEPGCESSCEAALRVERARVPDTLERACAAGRAVGCELAARVAGGAPIYRVGHLEEARDDDRIRKLRERACNGGIGAACDALAGTRSSETGALVLPEAERDRLKARACTLGIPAACLEEGDRARQTKDQERAENGYDRACELGMPSVCKDLAQMYAAGVITLPGERPGEKATEPWRKDDAKAAHFRSLGARD
jgi:TPR repeat protein